MKKQKKTLALALCLTFCAPAQAQTVQEWLDNHPKTYKTIWFLTTPLRVAKRLTLVPVREVVTGYRILVLGETPEYADAIAEVIVEGY